MKHMGRRAVRVDPTAGPVHGHLPSAAGGEPCPHHLRSWGATQPEHNLGPQRRGGGPMSEQGIAMSNHGLMFDPTPRA